MTEQLQLEIITPEKKILETVADWVTIPGQEGELGILPQHVPVVTRLGTGLVQVGSGEGVTLVAVHYGYAQVQGDKVSILSEMAELPDELDLDRARDAEKKARAELNKIISEQSKEKGRLDKYEAKLKRSIVRQSLGG